MYLTEEELNVIFDALHENKISELREVNKSLKELLEATQNSLEAAHKKYEQHNFIHPSQTQTS